MALSYFRIDTDELFNRFIPENENVSKSDFKFSKYHRDGDKAYIEFEITNEKKKRPIKEKSTSSG